MRNRLREGMREGGREVEEVRFSTKHTLSMS